MTRKDKLWNAFFAFMLVASTFSIFISLLTLGENGRVLVLHAGLSVAALLLGACYAFLSIRTTRRTHKTLPRGFARVVLGLLVPYLAGLLSGVHSPWWSLGWVWFYTALTFVLLVYFIDEYPDTPVRW